ncbi:DUF1992 domain-containing protein [Microbacterium sp. EYE_5]|uniref:DnaJ family domain-containing protein n=1 Tax=unclassified Microbacterium TaxID=2609290 RepID=UPI002006B980|nr:MULTISPECIES: DUF1992 domain-containing protein [unclassified Microbacterium]MCK6080020.1 DUF1992 domain-containing protein [Microbacterium sp. EYE_382]MCK6085291.1 DUF1992 domain-containing protein [Microbacterium sp. EYE_384]MCK6122484.1 DUF1992 domain-containing protein [Microbacterium sp. EYE_80]MCK6126054.1 DUF1992 domain-containing protein [Microbacterium sp. EYE_79]MCK6140975.1 DUF1992 domain-containing protein [Microbacterium sp. EYE_39]
MADDRAENEDPRVSAARYRAEKAARENGETPPEPERHAGTPTGTERAMYVETAIQQAIRRGDFDDLPGAGKPIEGLGASHDPDWWIRRKIANEQLTGLGPPALRLRIEHTEFEQRVDALSREDDVREYTEDFSRRVVEARRQLLGGPPVVTPTRDPDEEVAAWRDRRAARLAASAPAVADEQPRRRWRRRR